MGFRGSQGILEGVPTDFVDDSMGSWKFQGRFKKLSERFKCHLRRHFREIHEVAGTLQGRSERF